MPMHLMHLIFMLPGFNFSMLVNIIVSSICKLAEKVKFSMYGLCFHLLSLDFDPKANTYIANPILEICSLLHNGQEIILTLVPINR